MRIITSTILLLTAMLCSLQCAQKGVNQDQGSNTGNTVPKTGDITGLWVLQDLKNSAVSVQKGTFIQIMTNGYHLYAGCNQMNGELQIKDNALTIKPGMSTMMACDDGGYEQKFSALMWTVNTYQLEANQLSLNTTSGATVVFKKQTPAEHLVGKEFQVQALTINNGVVSSIDAPLQTLRFGQDGTLSGNAGCNNYTSTYKIEGNRLQIGQVASTKMACMDEKNTQYESVFFQHLQKTPLTIEDTPNIVTLRESNGSTVMQLVEIVKK